MTSKASRLSPHFHCEAQCAFFDMKTKFFFIASSAGIKGVASHADVLWARHSFFPQGGLRDEPKERLRGRL